MQSHTYKVPFEDFPISGDWLDGNLIIEGTRYDWEVIGAEVFAGRNAEVLIAAPDAIAEAIREYFMARPSWTDAADLEHRAYFPPTAKRARLIPAWAE